MDIHLDSFGEKTAIIWEAEDGSIRRFSYRELYHGVCRTANALKALGAEKGDRITLYMPMVPEAVMAMLACARIGAAHNVVFAGFSADALRERIQDSESKIVITADGLEKAGAEHYAEKNRRRSSVACQ